MRTALSVISINVHHDTPWFPSRYTISCIRRSIHFFILHRLSNYLILNSFPWKTDLLLIDILISNVALYLHVNILIGTLILNYNEKYRKDYFISYVGNVLVKRVPFIIHVCMVSEFNCHTATIPFLPFLTPVIPKSDISQWYMDIHLLLTLFSCIVKYTLQCTQLLFPYFYKGVAIDLPQSL